MSPRSKKRLCGEGSRLSRNDDSRQEAQLECGELLQQARSGSLIHAACLKQAEVSSQIFIPLNGRWRCLAARQQHMVGPTEV